MTSKKDIYEKAREIERNMSATFGHGGPENPAGFFEDKHQRITCETYDADGSFTGWVKDRLEPAEYFKRRLKCK